MTHLFLTQNQAFESPLFAVHAGQKCIHKTFFSKYHACIPDLAATAINTIFNYYNYKTIFN